MLRTSENVEKEILLQYKYNLKDILTPEYSDEALLKWLRARNFNVKESEKIFRQNFYNRIIAGYNDIVDSYDMPQVLRKYAFSSKLGFAKDGSILRYLPTGRYDFYGLIMSTSTFQLCQYFTYLLELDIKHLKEENLKTGNNIERMTYIIDMEGFSLQQIMHQCVIEMGLDFTRLLEDCYPELCGYVLVVNAPLMSQTVYSIFKPVLSLRMRENLKIVGKESSRNLLLKYIDVDVLPEFLGGRRVDSTGDPHCKEFVSFGGKIPETFYLDKCRIPLAATDPGVEYFVLGPRGACNFPIIINESNTRVRVESSIENGSLWFLVLYKDFGTCTKNPELPAPYEYINADDKNCPYKQVSVTLRSQAYCHKEDAIITCKWPGIYILRVNNSGSWFSSRKGLFRHTILQPGIQESQLNDIAFYKQSNTNFMVGKELQK